MILENAEKTAVVCFARMNPPTVGHLKLVNKMKHYNGDKYIFLSHSLDATTDPLPYEKKKWFVKKFFPDINVGHDLVTTPIKMMIFLEKLGYKNVIMVTGSDRLNSYTNLLNKYNRKSYSFNTIEVVNAGNRNNSSFVNSISGTKMRKFVKNNNYKEFKKGVPNMKLSDKLFKELQSQMVISEGYLDDESDGSSLVMNYPSLISYIKKELIDYIDYETDIEKLVELLRLTMHKSISKHGKKYKITKERADLMVESIIKHIDVRARNNVKKLKEHNGLDIFVSGKSKSNNYYAYAINQTTGKPLAKVKGPSKMAVIESINKKIKRL